MNEIELVVIKVIITAAFFAFLVVVDELFQAAGSVGTNNAVYYMAPGNWKLTVWQAWTIVFFILAVMFLLGILIF